MSEAMVRWQKRWGRAMRDAGCVMRGAGWVVRDARLISRQQPKQLPIANYPSPNRRPASVEQSRP